MYFFSENNLYNHSIIDGMEDLGAASVEDAVGWFDQFYRPSYAVVVLAGDIDVAEA